MLTIATLEKKVADVLRLNRGGYEDDIAIAVVIHAAAADRMRRPVPRLRSEMEWQKERRIGLAHEALRDLGLYGYVVPELWRADEEETAELYAELPALCYYRLGGELKRKSGRA